MSHTTVVDSPRTFHLSVPTLESGDRLSQEEFHRRYEAMPDDFKAELIGGIVYVASPTKRPHGDALLALSGVIFSYLKATPGVDASSDATTILGEWSEPRPDVLLRIRPEYGGQSSTEDDYYAGPPELIAEVAHSSVAIDLHAKKEDYEAAGVLEYVVVCLREGKIRWFVLEQGTYKELPPDADGVFRSRGFPGLWVDSAALLEQRVDQLVTVLEQGLASDKHTAFVKGLESKLRE